MSTAADEPPSTVRITWRVVVGLADPAVAGWARVRDAQFRELVRQLPVVATANVVATLLLASLCWGQVPAPLLIAWAGIGLGMLVVTLRLAHGVRHTAARPGRAMTGATCCTALFGLLWSLPPSLFASGTGVEPLAICLVTTAMMGLVTLSCSSVPAAAASFLLPTALGLEIMMAQAGSLESATLPLAYAAFLCVGGASAARALIARRWAELALEEQQEVVSLLLRDYQDGEADWLWEVDTAKHLRRVSPRLARAAGRPAEELEGQSLLRMLAGHAWHDGDIAPEIARLVEMMNGRESFAGFDVPVAVGAEVHWWSLSAAPRFDERGGFCGYRGVGSDVTEQRRSATRIEHAARFDALTGLANRAQFINEARDRIADTHRDGGRVALLLIDLDKFKPVNDTLGHPVGDKLLKRVADRIGARLADGDLAGRLGGDEFAVLMRRRADDGRITTVAAALIAALTDPFEIDGNVIRIGASIGSALAPRDGRTVETLVRHADLALYKAKADGRGCHRRFAPALLAESDRRRETESALREALNEEQFTLLYQPVVDGRDNRVVGFEALVRWVHPTLGEIPPADFLQIAEEARLTSRLGAWVLRTACAEAARWPHPLRVAVNVSREQLGDRQLVATVSDALARAGLSPQRLELDVPEGVLMRDDGQLVAVLDQLQALGVRIALDDFGTGYAALGYFRQGRFDSIKIDQHFVRGAARNDAESLAIIRSAVAAAGTLDIATVAEGMETEAEYRRMRELGCRHVQGHLSGAPIPAEAVRGVVNAVAPVQRVAG